MRGSFQLLHRQTGGQGLLQLLCLLFVCDDQGVKVSAASNFKLHIILIFLDLDRLEVLLPGCKQKVLDFLNFADMAMRHKEWGHHLRSRPGVTRCHLVWITKTPMD